VGCDKLPREARLNYFRAAVAKRTALEMPGLRGPCTGLP
jgi:hypothetical protein